MNIYQNMFKLILALYLGYFLSGLVLSSSYIQILALFVGVIFLIFTSENIKFVLFTFAAFYPFMFKGGFKFISDPEWIIFVAPILCFLLIIELLSRRQPLYSKKAYWFFVAVGVFALWAVVNYIKHPVLGQQFAGVSEKQGGLRSYITVIVGVATFLCSFWVFRYKQIDFNKWLRWLLILSVIIGVARAITYFTGQYLPFLGGPYKWHTFAQRDPHEPLRIGGLSDAVTVGIAILLSLMHGRRWTFSSVSLLGTLLMLLILSGGRGSFFGAMAAVLIYIAVVNRKYLLHYFLCIIVFFGGYILFDLSFEESKFARVLMVSEKHIEQEQGRILNYEQAIDIFLENPIFGKGLGYMEDSFVTVTDWRSKALKTHVTQQLTSGGHGAYTSLLMTFGIGGIFFIAVMLFGGIYCAFKLIRSGKISQQDVRLAVFAFIYLVLFSIELIPRYDGYSNMRLWFIAGMLSGIRSKGVTNNEFNEQSTS